MTCDESIFQTYIALTSEIDRTLGNTVSILLSGEDSGWFVDHDASLSSSYSEDD